ncbi:MAG: glycoside hydrolase family 3 domain protein, partial [Pedosphaera sp.]|nr:glycoside hydrolase family 3 domain protein [Pedosphaera sp.]
MENPQPHLSTSSSGGSPHPLNRVPLTSTGQRCWPASICKIILASAVTWLGVFNIPAQAPPNADRQAEALLSQMTLEEKIGQMTQVDMNALTNKSDIQKYGLGSMLSGGNSCPPEITARGWLKACEEYQSWALKTRLKIPLLYGIDAVHGHNKVDGAVVFPHNIGLGATHNPGLVEQAERVTASEIAGTGIRWAFAPCIAVARHESWGRTYESFGDSPDLVSKMGAAAVRGLQGKALSAEPATVLACAKHFLADGGTQNGVDQGDTQCDEATLRKVYLPPYLATIKAGVGSIMVSYNSWNG